MAEKEAEMKEINVQVEPTTEPPKPSRWKKFIEDKFWFRTALFLVLVVVLVAVAIGAFYGAKNATTLKIEFDRFSNDIKGKDGIVLVGSVVSLDARSQRMAIQWKIEGAVGNFSTEDSDLAYRTKFRVDGVTIAAEYAPKNRFEAISYSFTATHAFDYSDEATSGTQSYPFDHYQITSLFEATATEVDPNDLTKEYTVPILSTIIIQGTQGWAISTLNFTDQYPLQPGVNPYVALFDLKRSSSVITYVVFLIFFMWLIALIVLSLSLLGSFWYHNFPPPFIVMPASVLFAFPGMRNSMPEAPPVGAYMDIVGFFFNMIIVAVSFVIILIAFLYKSKHAKYAKKD
eukprot:TRINITY_DN2475_c0_g1_i1.p1 TRINITY_DN2475_c0_g1~~TRINITY_DN2475_c0_g1_i1.p1  ORF type:complete len:344 (-),score=93.43 TRINITY_DN2475_c0_g1_i1:238-1269(-)